MFHLIREPGVYRPIEKGKKEIITVIQDTIKDLKKGTLEGIKKQLKLSREEFIEILRTC